jgi:HAD-superfamily hydrolase, subfamily IIB
MKIKLIVTDLDGTLLDSNSKIPNSFFSIYECLKKKNIKLVIASGRQINNLQNMFSSIKDELTYISQNGSYIVHDRNIIFSDPICQSCAKEIILAAKKMDIHILVYTEDVIFIENNDMRLSCILDLYNVEYVQIDNLLSVNNIYKITVISSNLNTYNELRYLKDRFNIVVSGENWIDITNRSSDKGKGLSIIQKKLKINPSETMVFGDQENDLEMFKYADYSYAVENADLAVKKRARFIAPSNIENGVMSILCGIIDEKLDNIIQLYSTSLT